MIKTYAIFQVIDDVFIIAGNLPAQRTVFKIFITFGCNCNFSIEFIVPFSNDSCCVAQFLHRFGNIRLIR